MSILSIQSHVAYGYAGNKSAVFPLQSMGYDVWPIYTVQFSNHTGYGKWRGSLFEPEHIVDVASGIEDLGVVGSCQALLSGYLGSGSVGRAILQVANRFRSIQPNLLHICDPVMGDRERGIFVRSEVVDFFKSHLSADIITPNHFEAELLVGFPIDSLEKAKQASITLHQLGVKIVIITSLQLTEFQQDIQVFLSDRTNFYLAQAPFYAFEQSPTGTGDLFTALFLGSYLKSLDSLPKALLNSLILMDRVMYQTWKCKSRELKLLEVNYREIEQPFSNKDIFCCLI